MISHASLIVLICNFIAIGLLPLLFFRRDGSCNLRWMATGAPFFVAPVILVLGFVGAIKLPAQGGEAALSIMQGIAVVLAVVSIALIAMTVGTHRVPLALWHQDNDAPVQIVTWGPYKYLRHPFYTSFLLAFAAAVFAFPHWLTIACLIYGIVALTVTARGEEKRLAESEYGEEYRQYMSVSGRFFPRLIR
jgi:protein-S-isoprenylcysteine O-methyltransferase Ste14